MSDLEKAAVRYVEAHISYTKCKQDHFVLSCFRCKEHIACKVMSEYCDSWIKLNTIVLSDDGDETRNEYFMGDEPCCDAQTEYTADEAYGKRVDV